MARRFRQGGTSLLPVSPAEPEELVRQRHVDAGRRLLREAFGKSLRLLLFPVHHKHLARRAVIAMKPGKQLVTIGVGRVLVHDEDIGPHRVWFAEDVHHLVTAHQTAA